MGVADEYLRHGARAAAVGLHFLPRAFVHENVDFLDFHALLFQQRLGAHAVGANRAVVYIRTGFIKGLDDILVSI